MEGHRIGDYTVWLHPSVDASPQEAYRFLKSLTPAEEFAPSNVHRVYRAPFAGMDCIVKVSLPHRTVRRSQHDRFERLVALHLEGRPWMPMPVALFEESTDGALRSYALVHRYAEGEIMRQVVDDRKEALEELLPKVAELICEQKTAGVHSTDFTTKNFVVGEDKQLRLIDLDAIALSPPDEKTLPKMLANLRMPVGAVKRLLDETEARCGLRVGLGKYLLSRYALLVLRDVERHPTTKAIKAAILGRRR